MRDKGLKNEFTIQRLFPNIVTMVALCAGLTAVRYGLSGKWEHSIAFLLIAAFLDGMDGRIARYFNATSDFGANLDSLADFFNFGIAPVLIMYMWILQDISIAGLGWVVVLVFSICMAIRLARFNVSQGTSAKKSSDIFFVGVPAPLGAALVIMPMMLNFEFGISFAEDGQLLVCAYVLLVAFSMASTIPTFSIKKLSVTHQNVRIFLAFVGLIIAFLVIKPWLTLTVVGALYILSIPIACIYHKRLTD